MRDAWDSFCYSCLKVYLYESKGGLVKCKVMVHLIVWVNPGVCFSVASCNSEVADLFII